MLSTPPRGLDWSPTPSPDEVDRAIGTVAARQRVVASLAADGTTGVSEDMLRIASLAYFVLALKDDKGQPLLLPWHIAEWAEFFQNERLLCLMAARDHGKTFLAYAYLAWRIWRHNRGPDGTIDPSHPDGNLEVVYFTANYPLSLQRFERLKQFLTDNLDLFGDIMPTRVRGAALAATKTSWSKTQVRMGNGVLMTCKSIGSSTRGLHPQVIVADDIVDDKNARTKLQRDRVWSYLVGTIMPMAGTTGQLVVMGTPQHQDDTLYRLKGKPGWRHLRYRAADFDGGVALWPGRYSLTALRDIQLTDPLLFSREYQMDARDDASSIFPYPLTGTALVPGGYLASMPVGTRLMGDVVVAGFDLAVSESVGADFTVGIVAVYNRYTQKRRVIWACRKKGLTFDDMVWLLRDTCKRFGVDVGVVEENGFQRWLHQHLARFPETNTRVFGHTTGMERQSLTEGIPGLKLALQNHLWEVPSGLGFDGITVVDPEAADWVANWRSELNAMGYQEGKLQGVGEHDDTVLASWFTERAVRLVEAHLPASSDIVTGEDLGIERVNLGAY